MKKDKLFDLLRDFVYGIEPQPQGQEIDRLIGAGVDIAELWESVDWFLEKIAEKYGED
jgi:hypothetical protein